MKKFSVGLLVSSSFLVLALNTVTSLPPAQAAELSMYVNASSLYIPNDPVRPWYYSWFRLFGF